MWAVVPVKPLALAKSRLAELLSAEDRARLQTELCSRLFDTLASSDVVETVLVVTSDPEIARLARRSGGQVLPDPPAPAGGTEGPIELGLNAALEHGRAHAEENGAQQLLVLPGDLPNIAGRHIEALARALGDAPGVVVVPDRHGEGTNALVCQPAGAIPFGFGRGSAQRHLDAARRRGLRAQRIESPALGLDLDTIEDLEALLATGTDLDVRDWLGARLDRPRPHRPRFTETHP